MTEKFIKMKLLDKNFLIVADEDYRNFSIDEIPMSKGWDVEGIENLPEPMIGKVVEITSEQSITIYMIAYIHERFILEGNFKEFDTVFQPIVIEIYNPVYGNKDRYWV